MLRDRAAAEAYVASVCFKHGPPRLTGVELEWLVPHASDKLTAARLRRRARAGTPRRPRPVSPADPLPGGSRSPSNPVARSSWPARRCPDLGRLRRHRRRRRRGAAPPRSPRTASPSKPGPRRPDAPAAAACSTFPATARWSSRFDRRRPARAQRACAPPPPSRCASTRGSAPRSPRAGRPCTRSARCCSRRSRTRRCCTGGAPGGSPRGWACGCALDPRAPRRPPSRRPATRRPPGRGGCSTPSCCACGGPTAVGVPDGRHVRRLGRAGAASRRPPTVADLDYHVSTLFPPVRPRGHLEVRYVDAQPGPAVGAARRRAGGAAVRPGRDRRVRDRPARPRRGRWVSAARHGLADRVLAPSGRRRCSSWPSPRCPAGCSPLAGRRPRGSGAAGAARAVPADRHAARCRHRPRAPADRRRTRAAGQPATPRRHRMTVTDPGPARRSRPRRCAPAVADLLTASRARSDGAHRRRRRGRPRRPALAADVAAGLGPRAHRQPGGAVAGARRRRPRAAAPGDRRALRRVPALPGEPGRAAAAHARPRRARTWPRCGTRRSTRSGRSPLRGTAARRPTASRSG